MSSKIPGVAGFSIEVSGVAVDPTVLASVVELVVDNRMRLPDRLVLRLRDDGTSILDAGTFAVGAAVVVRLASARETETAVAFDGQVTTVAPEFVGGVTQLGVLALDRGCRLQRQSAVASYQNTSYGSIASQVASSVGLKPGSIEDGLTLPFVQQSNETDWDFLWRLAGDVDYQVKVVGRQLNFGPPTSSQGEAVDLTLGAELRTFRPRISGVGQVDSVIVRGWDPQSAQAIVGAATPGTPQSSPGVSRDDVVDALGSATTVVVDHPVLDANQADVIARGLASRVANAFVEGEGSADGSPLLTAGGTVNIKGIGDAFSGIYALSGVRHVVNASIGYETRFYITGREDRSLLGLTGLDAPSRHRWQQRIVLGVVTNNQDPDKLGRVRVRYPTLDDSIEGWWARVATPGAGAARGSVALPLVGDEVLVAFEHGNEQHPYVLGSLFNGQAAPGDLVTEDGSFAWTSLGKMTMQATKAISVGTQDTLTLRSARKATLTTTGGEDESAEDVEVSASGGLDLSGESSAKLSGQSVTVDSEGGLTLSGATEVKLSSDGQLTIQGASVQIKATTAVQISAPQVLLG